MADTKHMTAGQIGPEMVAYLLTVSSLSDQGYSRSFEPVNGLPLLTGIPQDEILRTYAKCMQTVMNPHNVEKYLQGS